MRFLLYNIRYGTGGRRRLPWSGYLGRTTENFAGLTDFVRQQDPDIVGLVEVDAGSYRSARRHQAQHLAEALGHYHTYGSKYHEDGLFRQLPVFSKQGNAFLTKDSINDAKFHYFERGVKRLVIELDLPDLTVFLVHLSLGFRARHGQLSDLYDLVRNTERPHIVAGDFNLRWGDREITLFAAATGLTNADSAGTPTFPSWAPRRQLDFILHSPDIVAHRFTVPPVTFSDHLPLVLDFDIRG